MTQVNKETIQELASLCRIRCSEQEQEALLGDLQRILSYIDQLKEIDTADVAPCYQVSEDLVNVLREDKVEPGPLSKEAFLSLAPEHVASMVRVPTVIKQL